MSVPKLRRITRHEKSAALLSAAARWTPGGVHSGRRHTTPPVCPIEGWGSHFLDADGNEYVDLQAGYGAVYLGYAVPGLHREVDWFSRHGPTFGLGTTAAETEAAQLIVECVPGVEQVVLLNTGTEPVMHAMRVARAVRPGRPIVLKPQGGFNGGHDGMLTNVLSPPDRLRGRDPGSPGILDSTLDGTDVFRFNDLADLQRVLCEHAGRVAAVVLEPILHNAPSLVPEAGYLRGVRDLCDEHGALLVFDELLTGFRHALGGFQEVCQVSPDLTALGKALGNGYPVSALGGRADLMSAFSTAHKGDVFLGGTYNANAVAASAAVGVLTRLRNDQPHDRVNALGDRLRDGIRGVASELAVTVHVSGWGSITNLSFFTDVVPTRWRSYDDAAYADRARFQRWARLMIGAGVFVMPEGHGRMHLSAAHTEADVDYIIEAAYQAFAQLHSTPGSSP